MSGRRKCLRLDEAERAAIERGPDARLSARRIASDLGRPPSSVAAEMKANRTAAKGVLDAPGGDARQVHLDHRLFDAGLPALVALYDGRREPHALELGYVDRHLVGRGGEPAVVVAGAVRLALGAYEVVGFLREQCVQGVLDGFSHELGQVGLYRLVIDCYDGYEHGCAALA